MLSRCEEALGTVWIQQQQGTQTGEENAHISEEEHRHFKCSLKTCKHLHFYRHFPKRG